MLMTYASPELLPPTAGSVKQVDLPAGCRHLEPDGQSRDERKSTFELQFSQSRRLLHFVARRILHCIEEADEAVKNCRLTASRNPPRFTSEGAFKSWLVRILIGLNFGGVNAAERPVLLSLVPDVEAGRYFSLLLLSARAAAIAGPLVWSITVDTLEGHRPHGPKVVGDSAPAEQSPNPRTRIRAPKALKAQRRTIAAPH